VGYSGKKWLIRTSESPTIVTQLIGEFPLKLDAKSRISLPAGLLRQVPAESADKWVINRGFEACLVLYPAPEWESMVAELGQLNPYVRENREFLRYFLRGATSLESDSAHRLLLPKPLLQYAGIDKDLVLFGHLNRLEIWSEQAYLRMLDQEPQDFSALAERVMGGKWNG
jgi:MraZ protein